MNLTHVIHSRILTTRDTVYVHELNTCNTQQDSDNSWYCIRTWT